MSHLWFVRKAPRSDVGSGGQSDSTGPSFPPSCPGVGEEGRLRGPCPPPSLGSSGAAGCPGRCSRLGQKDLSPSPPGHCGVRSIASISACAQTAVAGAPGDWGQPCRPTCPEARLRSDPDAGAVRAGRAVRGNALLAQTTSQGPGGSGVA